MLCTWVVLPFVFQGYASCCQPWSPNAPAANPFPRDDTWALDGVCFNSWHWHVPFVDLHGYSQHNPFDTRGTVCEPHARAHMQRVTQARLHKTKAQENTRARANSDQYFQSSSASSLACVRHAISAIERMPQRHRPLASALKDTTQSGAECTTV